MWFACRFALRQVSAFRPGEAIRGPLRSSTALDPEPTAQTKKASVRPEQLVRATIFLIGVTSQGSASPQLGSAPVKGDDDSLRVADIDCRRKGFEEIPGEPITRKPRDGDVGSSAVRNCQFFQAILPLVSQKPRSAWFKSGEVPLGRLGMYL
jgi:hypothetical protein